MKVFVLYHPKSDHGTKVEDYATEFERVTSKKLELVSLETREGAQKAEVYGVTQYPAIIATQDDCQMQKMWQRLPQMSELTYYTE